MRDLIPEFVIRVLAASILKNSVLEKSFFVTRDVHLESSEFDAMKCNFFS